MPPSGSQTGNQPRGEGHSRGTNLTAPRPPAVRISYLEFCSEERIVSCFTVPAAGDEVMLFLQWRGTRETLVATGWAHSLHVTHPFRNSC